MSASAKSPASIPPRDARMENRKSRRASTDSVSAFSGSPEAQDLNRDAAARNLPSALAEVAAAATKNANKAAKTGPGIDDEDLFLYSSREAEEAKEGNEAAVLSSSEEEEEADVLATPPPQTEPAEEKDPKRVAHEGARGSALTLQEITNLLAKGTFLPLFQIPGHV